MSSTAMPHPGHGCRQEDQRPRQGYSEPKFGLGPGGKRERVHAGERPLQFRAMSWTAPRGAVRARAARPAPTAKARPFEFSLSRDEFLDLLFEELALPNLVKRHLASLKEYKRVRAGFAQTGVPTNINLVRTMRGATGRRIASSGPYTQRLKELEALLQEKSRHTGPSDPEVQALVREIEHIRTRMRAIPFIDTFDLRYNNRVPSLPADHSGGHVLPYGRVGLHG